MRTPLATTLLLLGICWLPAPTAEARPRRASTSDFWDNLANPGRKQYKKALKEGRRLLRDAVRLKLTLRRNRNYNSGTWKVRKDFIEREYHATARRAVEQLRRATRASPDNAEGHYILAEALYQFDRNKEAIKAYAAARRLDAKYHGSADVAFNVALAHTKLGQYEEAIAEYDLAERILLAANRSSLLRRSLVRRSRSLNHSNAAELLMAMGRLDESIRRYQQGLSLAPTGNIRRQAHWGLAVAYDRDEQVSKALEYARLAVRGQSSMRYLTSSDVFFVPDGEVHYYFALGYLVQGKPERARLEWQQFLGKLPRDQWAFRARTHLRELGARAQPAAPSSKRLAPVPGSTRRDPTAGDRLRAKHRISSYLNPIADCYDKLLQTDRDASGRIKVALVIGAKGKVRRARVVFSTVGKAGLSRCVLKTIRGMRFNRTTTDRALKLDYTFQFTPKK